jgi:hypothetical protein
MVGERDPERLRADDERDDSQWRDEMTLHKWPSCITRAQYSTPLPALPENCER